MREIRTYTAALALLAAFAAGASFPAWAQSPAARAQKQAVQHAQRRQAEGHPVIRQAIRQLQETRRLLATKAAHDFKGHRIQAIQSIDQAIAHLHQALEADKR